MPFGVNGANDDARCFGRNVLLPQVSSVRSNQSRQFFLSPGRCSRIFLQLTSFFFNHLLCSTFTIAPSLPLSKILPFCACLVCELQLGLALRDYNFHAHQRPGEPGSKSEIPSCQPAPFPLGSVLFVAHLFCLKRSHALVPRFCDFVISFFHFKASRQ